MTISSSVNNLFLVLSALVTDLSALFSVSNSLVHTSLQLNDPLSSSSFIDQTLKLFPSYVSLFLVAVSLLLPLCS